MARRIFNSMMSYVRPPPTAIQQLQAELDALPPGTERLNLSGRGLTTAILAGVRFPDSILELNLRENQIDSLNGVTFPPRLRMLDLVRNHIQVVTEADFPQSLRILYIHHNPVFDVMGGMINRRGLRHRAEADDDHFLALPDDVYRRRYLEPRAPPRPVPLPPGAVLSPLRVARTYQEYKDIMSADGVNDVTDEECREATCKVCMDPFVGASGRLTQPVFFHETHKSEESGAGVMWQHPCCLHDIARMTPNKHGYLFCPECRAMLDITPQQAQVINREHAATRLQRMVRKHQSRKRKSKTNTKSGGKKRKQRKQKQKRTVKKRKHSMKRK